MALNEIVFSVISDSFRRSARRVAPTLEEYIVSLYNAGIDKDAIRNLLMGERGEELIFGPIRNAFSYAASTNLERARQETRERVLRGNLPENQLYRWVLDPGVEHCEDCLERADREPMTWAEWELIGIPKAGTTQCNINCYCALEPETIVFPE